MTPATIFSLASMTATLMWALMIFLPKWKITRLLINFKIAPIALSVIYVIYVILAINQRGWMDFGSLDSVMALFTEENAVLAGWVHYLAFDLLIGMWILNQNQKLKIHQLIIAPCLFATFMYGPVGFLLFTIIKSIKQKQS